VPPAAVKPHWFVSSLEVMLAGPVSVQPVVPDSKEPFSTTSVDDFLRSALGAARAVAEPRRTSAAESFMLSCAVVFETSMR
jgi:hypothetical protein